MMEFYEYLKEKKYRLFYSNKNMFVEVISLELNIDTFKFAIECKCIQINCFANGFRFYF